MYIIISYNILYGIKYTILYHILMYIYALLQIQKKIFCIPFMIAPIVEIFFENFVDVNFHHKQLFKSPLFTYEL